MAIYLGFVSGTFYASVDSDLYLPQESWAGDRERCRDAHSTEEVTYRPKWRIALDLL